MLHAILSLFDREGLRSACGIRRDKRGRIRLFPAIRAHCRRTAVDKHLPPANIVILSGVSCLLFAILVASPLMLGGGGGGRSDPAVEASMLAELHLGRAMDEMRRTGACATEERIIRCDECTENERYSLDTRVIRDPGGRPVRISVRVRWEGPMGGGAVVATGILESRSDAGRAGMSGGSGVSEELADTE
jgi:hypothetical protein